MTLKSNRAPLLSIIKLYASFHHHTWIQTGVTVRKRLSWVVTSVTLTFDLWPWPFAWTSLLSLVITPENSMMIRWWEHSQKGVTDGQTDRQTENTICRAAWSQLKTIKWCWIYGTDKLIISGILFFFLGGGGVGGVGGGGGGGGYCPYLSSVLACRLIGRPKPLPEPLF